MYLLALIFVLLQQSDDPKGASMHVFGDKVLRILFVGLVNKPGLILRVGFADRFGYGSIGYFFIYFVDLCLFCY